MIARAAAATLALLLSGCVAFEHLPVAALDCDPQLAGRWIPLDEDGTDRGDDAITVDRDCRAVFPPPHRGGTESYGTTLRGFALDGWRYLAFSANDVERIMGMGAGTLADARDAAFLLRYRIAGDHLSAGIADPALIEEAIAGNHIDGRVVSMAGEGGEAANERFPLYLVGSDGRSMADLLRTRPQLFEDGGKQPLRLRRVAGSAP